jgi:hypothetical protein
MVANFCPNCGRANDESRYCPGCGVDLIDVAAPTSTWGAASGPVAFGEPTPPPLAPVYAAYAPQPTNGLAIASMVLGIVWIYWVGSILALVFGYVALGQIKRTNQQGRGMAIAGIVLGWIGVAMIALLILVAIVAANDSGY